MNGNNPVKSLRVERRAAMSNDLVELIELGEAIGAHSAELVDKIIEAQDNALQLQKEKAESSRRKAYSARPAYI